MWCNLSFGWVDLNMSNGNEYDSNSHQIVRTLQIKVNLIKVHDLQEHRFWEVSCVCILILTAAQKSKEVRQMKYGWSIL